MSRSTVRWRIHSRWSVVAPITFAIPLPKYSGTRAPCAVCREEWNRGQVDTFLREQLATTPPLPDKRILAGGAKPLNLPALIAVAEAAREYEAAMIAVDRAEDTGVNTTAVYTRELAARAALWAALAALEGGAS